MQDISTGLIHELSAEAFRDAIPTAEFQPFANLDELRVQAEERLQKAKDAVVPIREHQGPTFYVGEEVDLKGGKFRISAITDKRIYLDSIPK